MLKLLRTWDAWSKFAAVFCPGNFIVATLTANSIASDLASLAWWELLISLSLMPLGIIMMGTPQIAALLLIRWTKSIPLRISFLVASLALIGVFHGFVTTTDLTGSSTASLALTFYPLYWALGLLAVGLVLIWLQKLTAGEID